MYFAKEDEKEEIASNVDKYSDSYARDTSPSELKEVNFPQSLLPWTHSFGTERD